MNDYVQEILNHSHFCPGMYICIHIYIYVCIYIEPMNDYVQEILNHSHFCPGMFIVYTFIYPPNRCIN
jgi:formylmethanofuran dehydrogenase subunit E-like metal-binding protein